MAEDRKESIGALWLKESKNGNKFMSGVVEINGEKIGIVVFKNNYKKQDNHPDYRIYESEPREKKEAPPKKSDDFFEDDIPFNATPF